MVITCLKSCANTTIFAKQPTAVLASRLNYVGINKISSARKSPIFHNLKQTLKIIKPVARILRQNSFSELLILHRKLHNCSKALKHSSLLIRNL